MTDKISPELQNAIDQLRGLENQRNASQNECVQLAAQVLALQRVVAERDAKIADLEKKLEEPELPMPKPNGKHKAEKSAVA